MKSRKEKFETCKAEAYEYYNECKGILKIISLKDSLRNLFKLFNQRSTGNIPDTVTEGIFQAIHDLGSPFNTFAEIFNSEEFENWFLSLKLFLFISDKQDSSDIVRFYLERINIFRNLLEGSIGFFRYENDVNAVKTLVKPRIDLFINSALLMEEIKKILFSKHKLNKNIKKI